MSTVVAFGKKILNEDDGQDLVEYSLLAGLISIAAVGMVTMFGASLGGFWDGISNAVVDALT